MPTWGEILKELQEGALRTKKPPFDEVRRKYLAQLSTITGRNTILYATKWADPAAIPREAAAMVAITEEDIQGLMEVVHGLKGPALDVILYSPGGSAEATEALVTYLRTKFSDIRVIVPQSAMSAATMLACSANRIVMGRHSFLGPIDPQINGTIPAQAIIDQFELAKRECQDPKLLAAWAPVLRSYGPALLIQCQNALELSQELVGQWLSRYMFSGDADGAQKAREIANWLADHTMFKTHSRHISRDLARAKGLVIDDLEKDSAFQDAVLSVFHATTHTLSGSSAVKIIENQMGRAFVKQLQIQVMQIPGPPGQPQASPGGIVGGPDESSPQEHQEP